MTQPKSGTVTIFKKNVNVLRYNDVIRRGDQVFTPASWKLSEFKKSESLFQRGVEFTIEMTVHDVKNKLEEKFPDLKNQRFSCAAANGKDAKLDFDGDQHRVWDGRTLHRVLGTGNKALYIVLEVDKEILEGSKSPTDEEVECTLSTEELHEMNLLQPLVEPEKESSSRSNEMVDSGIFTDVSGTTVHGASLAMDPNEPILMKNQPTVPFVSGRSPHLISNTPVPPVRSQPAVHGSTSGNVQVATTSRLHTPQEKPSICPTGVKRKVGGSYLPQEHLSEDAGHKQHRTEKTQTTKVFIDPPGTFVEGGVPFLLKFYSGLPDGLRSGWAGFGDSERVELSRFNDRDILTGLNIPPSSTKKAGTVRVTVYTEDNDYLGETLFQYVDQNRRIISEMQKSQLPEDGTSDSCHGDEKHYLHEVNKRFIQKSDTYLTEAKEIEQSELSKSMEVDKEKQCKSPCSWILGEVLGKGAFGTVHKCFPSDIPSEIPWAVKMVKMPCREGSSLRNEIRIVRNLRQKRIVSYYGSEERDGYLHLFMEFMAGGSLYAHIKKNGVLSEEESQRYTKQMLQGIEFLHSQNVIHRDIKGSNVLLDGKGNVKLADFGLSKMIQKVGSKTNVVSHCGTPYWMAPEIFWGEGYGRKADIWSFGCTVVEMLTGKPPLGHLDPAAAIYRIGSRPAEPTLPETASQDAKEFIKAALTWKPDERPWADDLQRYKFVTNRTEREASCLQKSMACEALSWLDVL